MLFDEKEEWRFDVSQFEFGESGWLQMLPCFPDELASIAKVVPQRLEDMLQEVRPGRAVCNNMLKEIEGPALESKQVIILP